MQRKRKKHSRDLVTVAPLLENSRIPTVIRARSAGLHLATWAHENRNWIEEMLWDKRALLFRGFSNEGIAGFQAFVQRTSDGDRLAYRDRSTPRNEFADKIYCATIYPKEEAMCLHNEGSYWPSWPKKIYFGCQTNASSGGETPIADIHLVHERLDPAARQEFESKGVMYVRNYNFGVGLTWQEVFQIDDREEVEQYCKSRAMICEWLGEDRLRTTTIRPATRAHHLTGEPLWFNHIGMFSEYALAPDIRASMIEQVGHENLPLNTFYGDGSPISEEVMTHIFECWEKEKTIFPWEEGDIALYDNSRIAHGRQPYEGERLILVGMTEPWTPPRH